MVSRIKQLAKLGEPLFGLREAGGYRRNFSLLLGRHPLRHRSSTIEQSARMMRGFRDVVFFASRDDNAPSQLLKWFKHGFLDRDRTLVVGKILGQLNRHHVQAFEGAEVNYLFYRYLRHLDFSRTRFVFYPYNTLWNPDLVYQRGPQHVFLGHGDSDKAASTNPLIRIYDRIFVSGQVSIERLLDAQIVNSLDVTSGRVVRVGMPYLELPSQLPPKPQDASYVLYSPTWEGANARQQYSSLEGGFGEQIVDYLLAKAGQDVVFRPHPSTGQRDERYRLWVRHLIERFADSPRFHIHADATDATLIPEASLKGKRWSKMCTLDESLRDARWVVTDVSSVISASVFAACPFLVVVKPTAATPPGGLQSHCHATIAFGAPLQGSSLAFEEAIYLEAHAAVLAAREHCVGIEPYLMGRPYSEYLALIETSRENPVQLANRREV